MTLGSTSWIQTRSITALILSLSQLRELLPSTYSNEATSSLPLSYPLSRTSSIKRTWIVVTLFWVCQDLFDVVKVFPLIHLVIRSGSVPIVYESDQSHTLPRLVSFSLLNLIFMIKWCFGLLTKIIVGFRKIALLTSWNSSRFDLLLFVEPTMSFDSYGWCFWNFLDVLSLRFAKSKICTLWINLIIDEKVMFGKDYYV